MKQYSLWADQINFEWNDLIQIDLEFVASPLRLDGVARKFRYNKIYITQYSTNRFKLSREYVFIKSKRARKKIIEENAIYCWQEYKQDII